MIRWLQSPTTTTWRYTHRLRICVFLSPPSSYFDSLPQVFIAKGLQWISFFFIYLLPFWGLNLKWCLACQLGQWWLWVFRQLGQVRKFLFWAPNCIEITVHVSLVQWVDWKSSNPAGAVGLVRNGAVNMVQPLKYTNVKKEVMASCFFLHSWMSFLCPWKGTFFMPYNNACIMNYIMSLPQRMHKRWHKCIILVR